MEPSRCNLPNMDMIDCSVIYDLFLWTNESLSSVSLVTRLRSEKLAG